ncbi:MAG: glycosyltransferase [Verrucomicrobiia bacterium]
MSLIVAFNEAYQDPATVAICSAALSFPRDFGVDLWLITDCRGDGAAEECRRILHSQGFGYEVFRFVPETDFLNRFQIAKRLTQFAAARLLVSEMNLRTQRAIYLDADTFTRRSLLPLARLNLEGMPAAAVPNLFSEKLNRILLAHIDPRLHSDLAEPFNSGVLVIDQPLWQKEQISERASTFLMEHPELCPLADQDALNVALAGRWKRLRTRWNFQRYVSEASEWQRLTRVAVCHFAGETKPWDAARSRGPMASEYFAAARSYGLRNFRPSFGAWLNAIIEQQKPVIGYQAQCFRKAVQNALIRRG